MAWQTSGCGCGAGVGCGHRPTPICIVQGAPLSMVLTASDPVPGRAVRAEVRSHPNGPLLLDMAPYCSADFDVVDILRVDVPGEATRHIDSSGIYDIWVGDERLAFGPASLQLSVSEYPGTRIALQSWTPVATAGEEFRRIIATEGMMPAGESISRELPPQFSVEDSAGTPVLVVAGQSWTSYDSELEEIALALSGEETAELGPGRFTYSLAVANQIHERRVLLAGMLFVEEVMA